MKKAFRLLSVILTICLFIPTVNVSATQTQRLLGDVNNDGRVTISDVTALQRHIAQLIALDYESQAAGDADSNGTLNITDSVFSGNSATTNGGAIYASQGRLELTGTAKFEDNTTARDLMFNFQVSLIGVEAGNNHVRGFAEFGVGEQGIALAGIRYKF